MQVTLDMADAMELEQMLDFLADWMKSDHDYLAPSLARFLGVEDEDMGPDSLRDDFARFRFLLGATDGEGVFTPDEARGPRPRDPSPGRASTSSGHTADSRLRPGSRDLDAAAVAAILAGLKTAACTGWLDAADALGSLSCIRGLMLAIERGELALIEAARNRGVTWAIIAEAIGAAGNRQTAQKRHADLACRHGRPQIVDTAGREQPQPAQILPFPRPAPQPDAAPPAPERSRRKKKAALPEITSQVIAEGLYQLVKAPDHAETRTWHVLVEGTRVGIVRPTWRGERSRPGWEPVDVPGLALPVKGTGRITPAGNARTRDAAAVSLLRALQRQQQEDKKHRLAARRAARPPRTETP
jgi:hypothetical protein